MLRSNLLYACVCAVALTSNPIQASEKSEPENSERKRLVLQRQYSQNIERAILRKLILPPGTESGRECKATVALAYPTEVMSVEVEPCGENLVKAIEKAVFSAAIPKPPMNDLFNHKIEINFVF